MCIIGPQRPLIASLVVAGLLFCAGNPARSQDEGPGYGPPGYGPPGMGPDDFGPPGDGPYGRRGPGGMGRYDDGYEAMGPGEGGMRGEMGPGEAPGRGMDGPGPDGGPDGGGLTANMVTVQGSQRPYYVHVPSNLAKPAPVVFMFHGGGGRPQAVARRSGWNEEADRHGFIVVYPEGPPAPSGRGSTWNVGGKFARNGSDDVAYVAAILQDVQRNVQVDPARIYAAGHSMGGVFSYRLACEMSDTFAAIAPVSATMVEPGCRPKSPVAIFHIHGSADDRIPLSGGRGAMTAGNRSWPPPQTGITAWSRFDGCSGQPSRNKDGNASCETYDHCRATVEMCVLAGGTHPWPEGAADQIWAFFAAHPKGSS